jgi:signal transduction histidine kinase
MPEILKDSTRYTSFFNKEKDEEYSNFSKYSKDTPILLYLCMIILNIFSMFSTIFNKKKCHSDLKISRKEFLNFIYCLVNLSIIGYSFLRRSILSIAIHIEEGNKFYFNLYFLGKIKIDLDDLKKINRDVYNHNILYDYILTVISIINIILLFYILNKNIGRKNFIHFLSTLVFICFFTIFNTIYFEHIAENYLLIKNLWYIVIHILPLLTIIILLRIILKNYIFHINSKKNRIEIQKNIINFLIKFISDNNKEGIIMFENQEKIMFTNNFFENLMTYIKNTKIEDSKTNQNISFIYPNLYNYHSDCETSLEKDNIISNSLTTNIKNSSTFNNSLNSFRSKIKKKFSCQNLTKEDQAKRNQNNLEDIAEVKGDLEISHHPSPNKRKKSDQTFISLLKRISPKPHLIQNFKKTENNEFLQSEEIKELQHEEVIESLSYSHFKRKFNEEIDCSDKKFNSSSKNCGNQIEKIKKVEPSSKNSKLDSEKINSSVLSDSPSSHCREKENSINTNTEINGGCSEIINCISNFHFNEMDINSYYNQENKLKLFISNYEELVQKYSFLQNSTNNSSNKYFVLFLNFLLEEIRKSESFEQELELGPLYLTILNEENLSEKYGYLQITISAKKIYNFEHEIIILALRNQYDSVNKIQEMEKEIKLVTYDNSSEKNSYYESINSFKDNKIISKNFNQKKEERRRSILSKLKSSEDNKSSTITLTMYNQKVSALLHDFKHVIIDMHLYNEYLYEKFQIPLEVEDKLLLDVLKDYSNSLIQNMTFFLKDGNNFLCGHEEHNFEEVDLLELVCNMIKIFNRRKNWEIENIKKLGITCNRENLLIYHKLDQSSLNCNLKVKTNKNLLTSLLYNIISNSFKATKEGEICIYISLQCQSKILLSVIDTGPGIPDHILQNWAKPFNKGEKYGIGLGQFIMYTIAKNLNIEMPLPEKNSLGQGTITKLIIPIDFSIPCNLNFLKISDLPEYNCSNSNMTNLWEYEFSPVNLDYKELIIYNNTKTIQSSSEEEKFECIKNFEILCLDDDPIVIGSIVNKVNSLLKLKLKNFKFQFSICNDFKSLLFKMNDNLMKDVAYFIFILDLTLSKLFIH